MKKSKYLVVRMPVHMGIGPVESELNAMSEQGYSLHTITVVSTKEAGATYEGPSEGTKYFVVVYVRGSGK